ncbi:Pyrrolo-quinoline quinone [Corchorus olitorius]|uniref:Pyrrolo-quinoline quinone n=1 Tax=Corchorus olitorius TaxID=93759 RepID=A0A1R3HNE9_9ROSI|nr:Pyrrolo-quinoline quinone [Corchorus olitorius]
MKKAKPNTILMVKKGKKKAKGKFKPNVNDNKAAGKSKQIVAALKPKGGHVEFQVETPNSISDEGTSAQCDPVEVDDSHE